MMSSQQPPSTLDGLPKQFVGAMRTLFDIMDDKKTGFVTFSDIESRWEEGETKGLPKGVVESLRKVTPPNGLLSFERFCAGLKICLLRNRSEHNNANNSSRPQSILQSTVVSPRTHIPSANNNKSVPSQAVHPRPQSVPVDRQQQLNPVSVAAIDASSSSSRKLNGRQASLSNLQNHPNTAAVRPNNVMMPQQRAISMPQLGEKLVAPPPRPENAAPTRPENVAHRVESRRNDATTKMQPALTKPSLHPSSLHPSSLHPSSLHPSPQQHLPRKADIVTALHNWQMGFRNNRDAANNDTKNKDLHNRSAGEGRPTPPFLSQNGFGGGTASDGDVSVSRTQELVPVVRKMGNRRREPRRHTVANGIDYNMLKRMKQLEQEKDVLLQGLEAVDRARDWYLKQISVVQDKMKYIGKSNQHAEYSTESHQEKLNFQMARIFEVNQHLAALVESSEKGFPLHMNLAVRPLPQQMQVNPSQDPSAVRRLRDQNHQLTEEVGQKSERISQLESEKAALIRELFQARSVSRRGEVDDTTFM